MVTRKDAKIKTFSSNSIAGKSQPSDIQSPKSKAEFQAKFQELTPFSPCMKILNYLIYTCWSLASIATIGGILCAPAWAVILCFCVSYMRQSMWFIMIHLDFHLLFIIHHYDLINIPDEMVVCNHLGFMAWRHHYHKSDTFTDFWLRYRMSYFDYRMWSMIALESLVEYSLGFQYWWLNAMFQHTWIHIEAITHEWYHIPLEKRATYFRIQPVGWLWFFMEWIGMIDTVKHSGHHGHEITSQLEADDFFDMWVPGFMLQFADDIWRSMLKEFKIVEPMDAPMDHPQFSKDNQKRYHKTLTNRNLRNYLITSMIGVAMCCLKSDHALVVTRSVGGFLGLS